MKTLVSVFAESFSIWSRNFALMYIILLYSLLLVSVWPGSELPTFELRWGLLFLVLILLTACFMAGWFNMVAVACKRYFAKQKGHPIDLSTTIDAFSLFMEFLPGIARFFAPFIFGGLLQGLVILLIYLTLQDLIQGNLPILQRLMEAEPASRQALIDALRPGEMQRLAQLSMGVVAGLLAYGLYTLLTMFWPAYVVLYDYSFPRAWLASIRRFFSDPIRITAIGLFFLLVQFLLTALVSLGPIMFLVAQFLGLLFEIYMAILLFVYLMETVGRPVEAGETLDAHSSETSDDATGNR